MDKLKKFSVKDINLIISQIITNNLFILFSIKGRVSNIQIVENNVYFILKRKKFRLNCIIWKNIYLKNKNIKNGDIIICKAQLKFCLKKSQIYLIINDYNIKVTLNKEVSIFKKLIEKVKLLKKEKKNIKKYNISVAIITSIYGSALKDIISVINKNNNNTNILVYDIRVQGNKQLNQLCKGIEIINNYNEIKKIDVIIVSRGGGSNDDLNNFNSPLIINYMNNSKLPIVSGIGHQNNYSLVDYISDKHAITPSIAADTVSFNVEELIQKLKYIETIIDEKIKTIIGNFQQNILNIYGKNLIKNPEKILNKENNKLKTIENIIYRNIQIKINNFNNKLFNNLLIV